MLIVQLASLLKDGKRLSRMFNHESNGPLIDPKKYIYLFDYSVTYMPNRHQVEKDKIDTNIIEMILAKIQTTHPLSLDEWLSWSLNFYLFIFLSFLSLHFNICVKLVISSIVIYKIVTLHICYTISFYWT